MASSTTYEPTVFEELGKRLVDRSLPIEKRFRALFTLRSLGGHAAIDAMANALSDPSALLRHEIAYCFGQMGDEYAFPILQRILATSNEHSMVRHEAAEAIGALAVPKSMDVLRDYINDQAQEVAETCQLAVARVDWVANNSTQEIKGNSAFLSVDPAPPLPAAPVDSLKSIFLDHTEHIFMRYRAMFALRDAGTDESVLALASVFTSPPVSAYPASLYHSALLKHEVAFVLGQLQNQKACPALIHCLQDANESPMVRHEAAEALGAIAAQDAVPLLQQFVKDSEPIVSESCVVALDVSEYFNNQEEFQYADGLKIFLEKDVNAIKKAVP